MTEVGYKRRRKLMTHTDFLPSRGDGKYQGGDAVKSEIL
jgi:N-methylhydantoinase B/oxoprolinase/acetone carboxylase alpha subunit